MPDVDPGPANASPGRGDLNLTPREKFTMGLIYAVIALVTVLAFVAAFHFLPAQVPNEVVPGG